MALQLYSKYLEAVVFAGARSCALAARVKVASRAQECSLSTASGFIDSIMTAFYLPVLTGEEGEGDVIP